MSTIKITQVKSGIDRMERQKRTLEALGLRRVLYSVEVEATSQILGMVKGVYHLVKVEGDVAGSGYQVVSPIALQNMLDASIASEKKAKNLN